MGYIVTVKRRDGPPISYREFVQVVSKDPEFSPDPTSSKLPEPSFQWTAPNSYIKYSIRYRLSEITVDTLSGEVVHKLQDIAKRLDANVYTNECVNLSDIDLSNVEQLDDGSELSSSFFNAKIIFGSFILICWILYKILAH